MKLAQFLLLLLITLSSLQTTFAADKKQKLNFQELELELSSPKQQLLLLETIQLNIKLKNNLGQPIMADAIPDLTQDDIKLTFSFNKKIVPVPLLPTSIAKLISYKEIPTTEKHIQYRIIPRSKLFLSTGEYSFNLVFYKGKERLISNTLTINIVEPLGIDKEIYNQLKALPSFITLLDIPGASEEVGLASKLEKLAYEFPQSVYSNYIIFNLAEIDLSLNNSDAAIGKLTGLIDKSDFPFFDQIIEKLRTIYAKNKDQFMANYYDDKLKGVNLENIVPFYL